LRLTSRNQPLKETYSSGEPLTKLLFRNLFDKRPISFSLVRASGLKYTVQKEGVFQRNHVLRSDPEILAEMTDGDRMMQEIADTVNLTEAPEDAVCGLVIDLLQYCEREKIDWTEDVMSRARQHLRSEQAYEVQKR
jgi:hypothetical protein